MKKATFLFLSIGLLVTVNSQTIASDTSISSIRVVAPKKIIPGETFVVYVYGDETMRPNQQSVVVSLKHSSGRSLPNGSRRVIKSNSFTRIVLMTPDDADPEVGDYYIFVDIINGKENTKNKSIPVTVSRHNRIILIQTDKSVYNLDETMMGRAIVLDRQMKSATGAVTVTIQNPDLYTIARFSNLTLDFGVAKFEFPFSSQSVVGMYRVCATYEGLPKRQRSCSEFEVQRNVPRFACFFTPTDELLSCSTKRVCFSASANYISGNKVSGTLTASLKMKHGWPTCPSHRIARITIDGTTHMCFEICSRQFGINCREDVLIDVNVTDFMSETTVQCKGQSTLPVSDYSNTLTIIEEDGGFHPCQRTTVKVVASTWSGNSKFANISLRARITTRTKGFCIADAERKLSPLYQLTDSNGMATFSICMPCKALSVSIIAEAGRRFPGVHTRRSFVYSSERIVLSSNKQEVHVGETANITASFSSAATAEYYVVRDSQIVQSGGIRKTCYISFLVKSTMASKFTVIVNQRALATSRISFDVVPNTDSTISLQFQENEVRPGAKANLVITAPPMSYVGVMAVDQNSYVQHNENQLTTSKIYEEIDKFDEPKMLPIEYYECGWYATWHCNCMCFQPVTKSTAQIMEVNATETIRPISTSPTVTSLTTNGGNINSCSQDCSRLTYSKRYCSYIKANGLFTASGFQVYGSETASPTSCPKPNPPAKPDYISSCCSSCKNVDDYFNYDGREYYEDGTEFPYLYERDLSMSIPRVRTHSPKRWLWFDRKIRNDSLHEQVIVPDTMTSWIANAFAVSPLTSMSIASSSTLKVLKSFSIDIDLPHVYSVIRGELVEITLTVYNYLQNNLTAIVHVIVNTNDIRLVQGRQNQTVLNNLSSTIDVSAGKKKSTSYFLLPLRNGHLPIRATATSKLTVSSVTRTLLVEAEGAKEAYSHSSLLCLKDNSRTVNSSKETGLHTTKVFNVSLPLNAVPDSESAVVTLTTNYMVPTLHGLDNLLLPSVADEVYNMRNFAPAVYVARYLDTIDHLHGATLEKASQSVRTGYKTQINYQLEDGSYGNSDDCGSMWLTAFVLRTFSQANGLLGVSIDNKVQEDAIQFVQNNQNSDGSFSLICNLLADYRFPGCINAHGNCSKTAYVTLALLEAGVSPNNQSVKMAANYLSNNCMPLDCSSPYKLALVSFTLLRTVGYKKDIEKSLETLKKCAISDGDYTHWRYSADLGRCQDTWERSYYCQTRSCDVETTGYALLAFIYKDDIPYSLPIVRWLIKHLNRRGRPKFSQDMVVGLQALFEYAKLTASNKRAVADISLSADQLKQTLSIDTSIAMETQTVEIPRLPTLLNVTASGKGCVLVSVDAKYNVPKPDIFAVFDVSAAAVLQQDACEYVVTVCNKWLRNESDTSTTAITEITFFSGFHPVESELNQLNRCSIERTSFEGRVLKIHFDKITQTKCCFDVTMKRDSVVQNLRGVPVITYNYHEPEEKGGTMLYADHECP